MRRFNTVRDGLLGRIGFASSRLFPHRVLIIISQRLLQFIFGIQLLQSVKFGEGRRFLKKCFPKAKSSLFLITFDFKLFTFLKFELQLPIFIETDKVFFEVFLPPLGFQL